MDPNKDTMKFEAPPGGHGLEKYLSFIEAKIQLIELMVR